MNNYGKKNFKLKLITDEANYYLIINVTKGLHHISFVVLVFPSGLTLITASLFACQLNIHNVLLFFIYFHIFSISIIIKIEDT